MIIIGISLLGSAATGDERGDLVKEFNGSIAKWNGEGEGGLNTQTNFAAAEFWASYTVTCTNGADPPSGGPTRLEAYQPVDTIDDDEGDPYEKLAYRWQVSGLSANAFRNGCTMTATYSTDAAGTNTFATATAPMSTTSTQTCARSSSSSSSSTREAQQRCASECSSLGGTFDGRTCTVESSLEAICTQTSQTSETEFTEQGVGAGSGCFLTDTGTAFMEGTYDTTTTGTLTVSLRSRGDPYMTYLDITDGRGFGLSRSEKVTIGLVLLVLGLCLCSFWVLTCYCCCKMLCGKNKPTSRPDNPVAGFYYDAANKYGSKIPGGTPPNQSAGYDQQHHNNNVQMSHTPPPGYPGAGGHGAGAHQYGGGPTGGAHQYGSSTAPPSYPSGAAASQPYGGGINAGYTGNSGPNGGYDQPATGTPYHGSAPAGYPAPKV